MKREKRCIQCNTLLAIEQNGEMIICYKELSIVAEPGSVMRVSCRKCHTPNRFFVERSEIVTKA